MKPGMTEHLNKLEGAIHEAQGVLAKHDYPESLRPVAVIGLSTK
jgi:hypothetical protein